MKSARVPFRVGGTCAINHYLRQARQTKDLDVFCKPGDFPALLNACAAAGFNTQVEDERWIAKITHGRHFCDVVFGSANMVAPVTAEWFREVHRGRIGDIPVKMLAPTELIWSKAFIMDRHRYDGNDVAHLILKTHKHVNWKRLMRYMDQHWEVLLGHVLNFRYIYPSERRCVPAAMLDALLARLGAQRRLPAPTTRVCRGRIFSRDDFEIDIAEWGFADLVGDHKSV